MEIKPVHTETPLFRFAALRGSVNWQRGIRPLDPPKTKPRKGANMPIIKGGKRDQEIKIRVTQSEKDQLNELKTQVSLAVWLRELGLNAKSIERADPELVRAIGRIGSNLNQIAKYVNTKKEVDVNVLSTVNRIESLLIEVINQYRNDKNAG